MSVTAEASSRQAGGHAARAPKRRNRPAEFTERDGAALTWLGEQYGARLDVLSHLLGRLGRGEPLSHRATRDQVERWKRAELVRVERALGQSWVTPTRRGLDRVGLDLPQWAVPVTRVRHCHAVNVVRLWWESQPQGQAAPWVSERISYRERGKLTWHIPDGVVRDPRDNPEGPTRHIAIEVELTHKTRRVLADEVFTKLRAGVESVLYFVPGPPLLDPKTGQPLLDPKTGEVVRDEAFAERLRSDIRAVCERLGSDKKWRVGLLPEVAGVSYMTGGR